MKQATIIAEFIDQIWNQGNFEKLNDFIHPDFVDHSLPPMFTPDAEGMKKWILATGSSFEHHTRIDEQVTEDDRSIVKITMALRHIGIWRGIEPTGISLKISGFRFYKLKDRKIIGHWGLIDGQSIENQLKDQVHGCKIAE